MARLPPEPQSALDAAAIQASLRRAARAAQPPWLHAEVARRMAQRLEIIRLKPELMVDWWGWLGASSALLQQAYQTMTSTI